MEVSRHANQRIRERVGVGKSTVDKVAAKALERGVPHNKTKGRLNKWITEQYFYNERANNIRIYGEKAYIFRFEKLITVVPLPRDLAKDLKKMIKK